MHRPTNERTNERGNGNGGGGNAIAGRTGGWTEQMQGDMRKLKDSTKRALVMDAFNQEMFLSKNFQHRATAEGGSAQ